MRIEIGDFILIPTKNQSKEDWLQERSLAIGGSDMGVLFNQNEYNSVTKLFYEKLGRIEPTDLSGNAACHYGNAFEDVVLRDSQYLEINGEKNNHVKNFSEGNKKASHVHFPYMIINKKYPHITCNVDGLKFKDKSITEEDLIHMVEVEGKMPIPEAIIECKTMNTSARDKWIDGMNPTYPWQVKTYCLPFLELNPKIYGEIYVFCYDQSMLGYRIDINEKDEKKISSASNKFQKIMDKGRKIIDKAKLENKNDDEINELLSKIHPEAKSSSPSLGSFLSELFLRKEYIKENETIEGDDLDVEQGLRSKIINQEIKVLNSEKTEISNYFKNKLVKTSSKVIDCNSRGRISYSKRLNINIK